MVDHVKVGQLRAALNREANKLTRQREAIKATEALIEILNQQISAEEKKK